MPLNTPSITNMPIRKKILICQIDCAMDRERLRKTNAGGQTCIKVDKCTVNTINTRNIAASALQTMGIASPAPAHVDDAANLGGP